MAAKREIVVPRLHAAQAAVVAHSSRFNVLCAGRRWGKSSLGIERSLDPLLDGQPVGWFAPTYKLLDEFWRLLSRLYGPLTTTRSEHQHRLELVTGGVLEMWSLENPDAARGRHYSRVILDECAVVHDLRDTWNYVIRPELMDWGGVNAGFCPRPRAATTSPFSTSSGQRASETEWASWRLPTADNPYIASEEIEAIRVTLTARAFQQEIEARFIDEVSDALWQQATIDAARLAAAPELAKIVVAIDPAISSCDCRRDRHRGLWHRLCQPSPRLCAARCLRGLLTRRLGTTGDRALPLARGRLPGRRGQPGRRYGLPHATHGRRHRAGEAGARQPRQADTCRAHRRAL